MVVLIYVSCVLILMGVFCEGFVVAPIVVWCVVVSASGCCGCCWGCWGWGGVDGLCLLAGLCFVV